jgi:hypothetical protein
VFGVGGSAGTGGMSSPNASKSFLRAVASLCSRSETWRVSLSCFCRSFLLVLARRAGVGGAVASGVEVEEARWLGTVPAALAPRPSLGI